MNRWLGVIVFGGCAILSWNLAATEQDEPHGGNLITLNVVALDGHDAPVTDLGIGDFSLSDRGVAQKITVFRRNQAPGLKEEPPLEPHQFSNRRGIALPHVTVILFDVLNAPLSEQGYVRNQLVKTLQHLESGEFLYLYLLTPGGLVPVRGLPEGDPETPGNQWTKDAERLLDISFQHTMRMNPGLYPEDRVKATFLSLEALANRLAAVTGRKNIVWLTRGVPIEISPNRTINGDFLDYEPLVRQLSSTLQQANVAIYPVDDLVESTARLAPSISPDFGNSTGSPGARGAPEATDPASRQGGMGSMQTLQTLANLTGGRTNFTNDVQAALKQALDDARFSYLIGYSPPNDNWDGKFHKIQLKCSRRGVHIQARQGYFAISPSSLADGQEQAALDAVRLSPFESVEIGLRVTIAPSAQVAHATSFQIQPDFNDIVLEPVEGKFVGEFSLSLLLYHAQGGMTISRPFRFKLPLTAAQFEEWKKTGINLVREWPIDDDVGKVRLVLFDYGSKSTGSITIPITSADRKLP